jgi:Ca2+-binding RTX toxin-like protein
VSNRVMVAISVLALPLALGVPSTPAQAAGQGYRCDGREPTIIGTDAGEVIHGTPGPDVIVGLGGSDWILGGGGDDLICGGLGPDAIDGGAGNDRIHGNAGRDTLWGGDGDDYLFASKGLENYFYGDQGDDTISARNDQITVDYAAAPNGISVDLAAGTATGWGTDTLHIAHVGLVSLMGTKYDDDLFGTSRDDVIRGDQGGEDTIDGRAGNDVLYASGGSMVGGLGNDELDVVVPPEGLAAGLDLDGGEGTDLFGLYSQGTPDAVSYDLGSGFLSVDSVTATATDFENFDSGFRGAPGVTPSYDVTGTDGPNAITLRQDASAVIHALGGDDVIQASDGDDLIDGGLGDDTADGHAGADTCVSVEHPSNCEVVDP